MKDIIKETVEETIGFINSEELFLTRRHQTLFEKKITLALKEAIAKELDEMSDEIDSLRFDAFKTLVKKRLGLEDGKDICNCYYPNHCPKCDKLASEDKE